MKLFQHIVNYCSTNFFFMQAANRNQFFLYFEHVLSPFLNVMTFMNCAFGKLSFVKQTTYLLLHGSTHFSKTLRTLHGI